MTELPYTQRSISILTTNLQYDKISDYNTTQQKAAESINNYSTEVNTHAHTPTVTNAGHTHQSALTVQKQRTVV
jgi:hypothetical protein